MKRLFFVNRYFFPDHSASSQLLSQLAFHLAALGHSTHVITSRQIYDKPETQLPAEEDLRGVTIHRIAGTHFGRSGLVTRAIDYLSFYWMARRKLRAMVERHDIIVTMTDPPLLSILGMYVARHKRAHLVNWLQDIYPEIAGELRVPFIKGPVGRFITSLRNRSLKAADINVVVGDRMAERLSRLGVRSKRIQIIYNWSDDERIIPVDPSENPLRSEWNLDGKFVVGYSGNLGRAHEFSTLLTAAEQLKDNSHIVFLFIGGGRQYDDLINQVKRRGLSDRFRFLPYQSVDALKYSLSVPDIHWISLRPPLEGLIVPSKVYGIAAAGRPFITVSAKTGEIGRLVEAYGCGIIIEPGDSIGLANTITRLSKDREAILTMGKRARAMLEARFTRHAAFEAWKSTINSIG